MFSKTARKNLIEKPKNCPRKINYLLDLKFNKNHPYAMTENRIK